MFAPDVPLTLPADEPNPFAPGAAASRYIDVSFDVTKYGLADQIEILDGLKEGDRFVTNGAGAVRNNDQLIVAGEGGGMGGGRGGPGGGDAGGRGPGKGKFTGGQRPEGKKQS